MAVYLILTEEEAEFLVECLEVWYANHPGPTPEDLKDYMDLRHYLMTGKRR